MRIISFGPALERRKSPLKTESITRIVPEKPLTKTIFQTAHTPKLRFSITKTFILRLIASQMTL